MARSTDGSPMFSMWLAVGLAMGVALGAAMDNLALWMIIGVAVGMGIGALTTRLGGAEDESPQSDDPSSSPAP